MTANKIKMTRRIIQFGTSRFLQAHADLFVHEAREAGQDIGPITIVKTTSGEERAGRVAAFGAKSGYPVLIRGMIDQKRIDETIFVKSVDSALQADRDWELVQKLFVHETDIVFSNVGESGYAVPESDQNITSSQLEVPASFPAKLLALLLVRFESGGKPMLILPCELVSENGKVLRRTLNNLALSWGLTPEFQSWFATQVTICDTLVDRIVSEAIDPIGAISEPYALWAIKREATFAVPFTHPAITITDNLEPYLRLKLHILNLGHSFLADIWLTEKRQADETVREILSDVVIKSRLMKIYKEEVIPGFAGFDMEAAAVKYVSATMERFQNPFLNHRLSDIAQNHHLKIERRVIDFISWIKQRNPLAKVELLKQLAKSAS